MKLHTYEGEKVTLHNRQHPRLINVIITCQDQEIETFNSIM